MRSYYEVLGVDPDAPQEAVEQAYRERVKETHPDLNDDPDATAAFREVQRAREVLTDPEERARYDRVGHATYTGNNVGSRNATAADAGGRNASEADHADGRGRAGTSDSRRRSGGGRDASRDRTAGDSTADATDANGSADESRAASESASETTTGASNSADRTSGSADRSGASDSAGFGGRGDCSAATGPSSGASAAASESGPYAVRNGEYGTAYVPDAVRVPLTPRTITLVGTLCLLYPVFVLGSLFPPFPLVVNLVVAACTLGVVMYLLSIPEVGILVFGSWTLLGPVFLVALGVPLLSLAGLLLVVTTWVPLGAAFLTRSVMRL